MAGVVEWTMEEDGMAAGASKGIVVSGLVEGRCNGEEAGIVTVAVVGPVL